MNVYSVKPTRQAEAQMRDIAWHIAVELHNPDAAENLMDEFGEAFETLGKNPEKHEPVDEKPWHSEGVRKTRVKHYLIYFWIDVENAAVQIMGIVYERRDQKKFLSKMNMTD
ncbi:MAG: type II toxin-antitoxin system RelE/ParE family toxin [Lachnospiraceae bacterium]|nr:type II toxin-antitoxin system RelE/ParE family toxin [Lachnospiraceae bacterium]